MKNEILSYNIKEKGSNSGLNIILYYKVRKLENNLFDVDLFNKNIETPFFVNCKIRISKYIVKYYSTDKKRIAEECCNFFRDNNILNLSFLG